MDRLTERLHRAPRVLRPRVWKTLARFVTVPENDLFWSFMERWETNHYLDQPVPWWTPGSIEELAAQQLRGMRALEWGAGASTLWLLRQGCQVTSIETDEGWADLVRRRGGAALDLRLAAHGSDDFLPEVRGYGLAIIDSERRVDVSRHLLDGKFDGLVVWDDSERARYREGILALGEKARRQLHFPGLQPRATPKMTSLFWMA